MFNFEVKTKKEQTTREYEESEELKTLAQDIIRTDMMMIAPAKVAYLMVSPNISKTVPAKIIKASPELNFFSEYNYIIEVSRDIYTSLPENLQRILLHDQLIRILPVMNEVRGEYQFKLRNPDYVAFKRIIDLYGTDWKAEVKVIMSSVYDLTPAQADSIKL